MIKYIMIILLVYIFTEFPSDTKFLLVYRTLLSILPDLNKAVVWMVLILPLIFSSLCLFPIPLWSISKAPTRINIGVTFMFHSFSNPLARSTYLSIFSLFLYSLWSIGTAKSSRWKVLSLLLINTRPGLLTGIQLSICISESPREFFALQFLGWIPICAYTICKHANY